MKTDSVNIALSLVREEIAAVVVQLNHEGAEAFRASCYEDARRLSAKGEELQKFATKLQALQEDWLSSIDKQTRERVKVDPAYQVQPHTKGPKHNLRIRLPNGRIVQRSTAAAAFVDVIESLGVDQVRALDLKVSGVALVGTTNHPTYGQKALGKWLICTHSNTEAKKKLLQRIAEQLGENLRVEVIGS